MAETQLEELVQAALQARLHGYAPYSQFLVGAALRTTSGRIFHGCNVENASYGLAICAERNAITSMVAAGESAIAAMAITCAGGGSPCGACRQVMVEFGSDFEVTLVDAEDPSKREQCSMRDLLPRAFKLKSS